MMQPGATILLTGATGFVGNRLWPALDRQGYRVRCLTRDLERARRRWPHREWVRGSVASPEALRAALDGCSAAYYLVHGMADGDTHFHSREVAAAELFRQAAAEAELRRVVYLGGVAPRGTPSEHLASRLAVGETLRAGPVPAIELRASMIIGCGSLSWQIVRDLAARLPAMILPRWLRSRTEPVGIGDVVLALTRCLELPEGESGWYDLPGPEVLSGSEILLRTAGLLDLRPPVMIQVPFLSPWLSSQWIRFISRADWSVAREVVIGLKEDLLAADDRFWQIIGHADRLSFAEAARLAIAEERVHETPTGFWAAEERFVARLHPSRAREAANR